MRDPDSSLELIRAEVADYFTRHGEYNITSPLLTSEIAFVFERAYTARFGPKPNNDPHKQDALQDVYEQLLKKRKGMKARYIHTVYVEYHDINMRNKQPYVLKQSRKALRKIIDQSFVAHLQRSVADNVLARCVKILDKHPYKTHFEGQYRRYTMYDEELDQLSPAPLPHQILAAVRAGSQVPKIPQQDHFERLNKVFHDPELHLLLQIILEKASGLTHSQLKEVIKDCLTDRPSADVRTAEDMNLLLEHDETRISEAAETAAHVRAIARDVWDNTSRDTKLILALQFADWPDQRIADEITFGSPDNPVTRSRAWVTTQLQKFGESVAARLADVDPDDQLRVARLLEVHIVEFDTELS